MSNANKTALGGRGGQVAVVTDTGQPLGQNMQQPAADVRWSARRGAYAPLACAVTRLRDTAAELSPGVPNDLDGQPLPIPSTQVSGEGGGDGTRACALPAIR